MFCRHSQAVEARVARLEITEQDLRTTVMNLNNMLQQALVSKQVSVYNYGILCINQGIPFLVIKL